VGRGKPALWSALLGLPFVGGGAWLYLSQQQYPPVFGVPFVAFGLFIITVGAYVHIVSPSKLRTGEGEEILMTRHPTQRVATVKISIGLPLLLLTVILLYFTRIPYVYPTLTFAVGLYTFSKGLYVYWANSLTTYYMTNQRVVKEYRFLSLVRREVPHRKVRGVQERQSLIETLVGLGNVIVASGGGRSLEVRMRNMERSEEFADAVRDLI